MTTTYLPLTSLIVFDMPWKVFVVSLGPLALPVAVCLALLYMAIAASFVSFLNTPSALDNIIIASPTIFSFSDFFSPFPHQSTLLLTLST